jgi:hypothetical protein
MSHTEQNSCITFVGNPERKGPFGKPGLTLENNFKICLKQMGRKDVSLRCVSQIGRGGGLLRVWKYIFVLHEMLGIYLIAQEQLDFQELRPIN